MSVAEATTATATKQSLRHTTTPPPLLTHRATTTYPSPQVLQHGLALSAAARWQMRGQNSLCGALADGHHQRGSLGHAASCCRLYLGCRPVVQDVARTTTCKAAGLTGAGSHSRKGAARRQPRKLLHPATATYAPAHRRGVMRELPACVASGLVPALVKDSAPSRKLHACATGAAGMGACWPRGARGRRCGWRFLLGAPACGLL